MDNPMVPHTFDMLGGPGDGVSGRSRYDVATDSRLVTCVVKSGIATPRIERWPIFGVFACMKEYKGAWLLPLLSILLQSKDHPIFFQK